MNATSTESVGSLVEFIEYDTGSTPPRVLLRNFQAIETWYELDDGVEVCADGEFGGIDLAQPSNKILTSKVVAFEQAGPGVV